jgi:hypothetical protein
MADALCESPAIRAQHERNKSDYAATQQSSDPMLAQVLWGAAGLLARAEFAPDSVCSASFARAAPHALAFLRERR